jgi:succinate dehydrogenase/fumarate reductase flavoprotein subunit
MENFKPVDLVTDVLIIGAGGAGMYAAIAAAGAGAEVLLLDKSLIGRGGATVMAQMTVAAAIGHQTADDWTWHFDDTLQSGRGLCNEALAALLCREAPARILEMDGWKAGWARSDGHIAQVMAPGHRLSRCCYVDFLNTGPAVSRTLRAQVARASAVRRLSNIAITEIVTEDGEAVGAVGIDVIEGRLVSIASKAVIIATGGLTKLYRRNSASTNMAGEGYALALGAGAELVDMEFVQFFPIGHLAPRLVGMDPIMWDPFRYKLGGRLLNGAFEEFVEFYGNDRTGRYTATRDQTAIAIWKEVEAGRGSPHGGAYLDFRHLPAATLRAAFGPVIDRLAANGIDLTRQAVEVAPIAHYHMGGIRVDTAMRTCVPGLFAAGEAVGGANGANRLSGNAVSEALVFGEVAGRQAATWVKNVQSIRARAAPAAIERLRALCAEGAKQDGSPTRLFSEVQELMEQAFGVFRTEPRMAAGLRRIREMRSRDLTLTGIAPAGRYFLGLQDRLEVELALIAAEAVAVAALARRETRGAHRREDYPESDEALMANQILMLDHGQIVARWEPVVRAEAGTARVSA